MLLATVAGLAVAIWAFGRTGLDGVLAIVGRMSVAGFLLYCGWSIVMFVTLGAAWLAAAPGERASRIGLFTWARMVREAVSDLLPFSQLGGLVVGARTVALGGVPAPRLYGSLVVDMTTEMAAQLVFVIGGLAIMASLLVGTGAAVALRPAILGGTALMTAFMLLFFSMQHRALDLTGRLAGRFVPASQAVLAEIRRELAAIYARRGRVWLAFLFNFAAWIATAVSAWLALRLMGSGISLWYVVSLEALICVLRSVAFFIPGALGVQEAAYALAGPLFGLSPELALALALTKRARDIALGLPTLLAWQLGEAGAVARRAGARRNGRG